MVDTLVGGLRSGGVFHPDDPERPDLLLLECMRLRVAAVAALCAGERDRTAIDVLTALVSIGADQRLRIANTPPLAIWLRAAASPGNAIQTAPNESSSHRYTQLLDLIRGPGGDDAAAPTVYGIPLHRFDVHPMIASVSPPTYDFNAAGHRPPTPGELAYPLAAFHEFATAALDRISRTWPALGRIFPLAVRDIVHLPEASFRSASAARYTGVVMIGADDCCLLELEESLVHECGHQLLYQVMELDPLIANSEDVEFSLPWSGAERDFYGFYHAFYIYLLLAKYYLRVAASRPDDASPALARLRQIATGLGKAVPEIQRAGQFTELGSQLTENLCQQSVRFAREYGDSEP